MSVDPEIQKEFFRAAAFLRREFLGSLRMADGAEATRAEIDARRDRTILLFDTDLIHVACMPWTESAERYGEVFPGSKNQKPETRKRTGAIIASYVLEQVRPGRLPIYQLEPHFKETQNIFEKNAKYFANLERARPRITEAVDRERVRRAAALLNHQLKAGRHGAGLLASLLQMLNALKPFNFPDSKSAQRLEAWDLFVKLNTRTGGIYPASRASSHLCQIGEDEIATVLDVFDETDGSLSDEEKGLVSRIATAMETRIEYFSSEKQKESGNIPRDAEAIARLYLVNARLVAAARDRPDNAWRAVFVTGSKAVTEACFEDPGTSPGPLPALTSIPGIDLAIAEGFSGKFVRHLWAYTTEALLETDHQAKFLGWLDGLLGAEAHPTHFTEQRLTEIVRRSHGRPSNTLFSSETVGRTEISRDDIEKWERVVTDAVTRERFNHFGIDQAAAKKIQDRIAAKLSFRSLDDLVARVDEQFQRAKDRAFVELSESGALAVVAGQDFGERNPPDLAFGSLDNTNKIFQRLCSREEYSAEAFHADLQAVEGDCHIPDLDNPDDNGDDRQRNHLKFLVIGAAFAAANKWGVALSQGERAVAIVERIKGTYPSPIRVKEENGRPLSHISGREAYFLCASAQRISASKPWELQRARQFLDKAEGALQIDRDKGFAQKTTKVRFWSESLAISLSEYYLLRWQYEELNLAESEEEKYCDTKAIRAYECLAYLLSNIETEACLGAKFSDPCANFRRLGRITIVSIAVNIIQCCVIRAFRVTRNRPDSAMFAVAADDLKQAMSLLDDLLNPPKEDARTNGKRCWKPVRETALINAYRKAGALLLNKPLLGPSSEGAGITHGRRVAVYDDWRFKQIELFFKEMEAIAPEKRLPLLKGERP